MSDRDVDGPPPFEVPVSQALAALDRWAHGARATLGGLTVTTSEALVDQIRVDIEGHYSRRHEEYDPTPVEVAEDLANARLSRAVQFDRAILAAKRWISRSSVPPGYSREDLEQEAMLSIHCSFKRGDILEGPDAFGKTVAERRWKDAWRHYNGRRLQIVAVNPLEPERDDEAPSPVAVAADRHSEEAFELADAELDRTGDLERRRTAARTAAARLSPGVADTVGGDRTVRCPQHRHRRPNRNTDRAYQDIDLAAVWIVFFLVEPHAGDCPADWSELRWAALGSVNAGRYGTWAPGSERRSLNVESAHRARASLCLLWRLSLVAECLEEVADLVLVVAPRELRQALVTWVGEPAQRRSDQLPWAAVEDAYRWCEDLVESLLARGASDGRWGARRRSEALAYRQVADTLRQLVATGGVPAELEDNVEQLTVDLAKLAERLNEAKEFPG